MTIRKFSWLLNIATMVFVVLAALSFFHLSFGDGETGATAAIIAFSFSLVMILAIEL